MRRFAYLALASAIAIWLLVVIGGIVRVTGSGMGCGPDWPLCNGAVIPRFDLQTFIEWAHRLAAATGSVLVLAVVFIALRSHYHQQGIRWLAIGTGLALLVQIVLGAITVRLDLAFGVVVTHLGVAAIILALLTVMATVAIGQGQRLAVARRQGGVSFAVPTAAATYVLMLVGAYMMGSGASLGCTELPLCNGGQVVPVGNGPGQIHMLHRFLAVVVGVLLAATIIQTRRARPQDRAVLRTAMFASVVYFGQVLVGIGNIVFFIPPSLRVAHLALAFALWAILVALSTLLRSWPLPREHLRPSTNPIVTSDEARRVAAPSA